MGNLRSFFPEPCVSVSPPLFCSLSLMSCVHISAMWHSLDINFVLKISEWWRDSTDWNLDLGFSYNASYNGVFQRWMACAHLPSPSLILNFLSVKGEPESTRARERIRRGLLGGATGMLLSFAIVTF